MQFVQKNDNEKRKRNACDETKKGEWDKLKKSGEERKP